jgi:indolepyruvate ferredoxin oxidoreductase
VPVSGAAIQRAIELNGEAVAMNEAAFAWGRRAAIDPELIASMVTPKEAQTDARRLSTSLEEIVERRFVFLTDYQSVRYARRYRALVERVRAAEEAQSPGSNALTEAVARYLYKLMAYKDEYEVARLFTDGAFEQQVAASFDGKLRYEFHLAPPLFARMDANLGRPRKMSFGPWILSVFKVLARLRVLRGTPLDPFGYTAERKLERRLVREYVAIVEELIGVLKPSNHALAVAIASMPEKMRGFGPVKAKQVTAAKAEEAALLQRFRVMPATDKAPLAAAAAE